MGEYIPWKIRYKYRLPEIFGVREPKGNHFFCLRFVFTIFYTGNFQVPPEKNHPHLKCQFPPKSQFDLSPSYVNILKNGSAPQGGANYVIPNKKIRLKPDISNPISGIPNIILLYRAYIAILSLTCLRRHQKL